MKNFKVFTIVTVMLLVSSVFNACKKEKVVQNEENLINQQKSASSFVLITEAERQYLLESGESMTIDEFQNGLFILFPIMTMVTDYIFVASTNDSYVFFETLTKDGNYESWYNRLNDHIYEHYEVYDPAMDPDSPSIKCLKTSDLKKIANWINEQITNKRDFTAKYDLDKEEWFLCNGDCCKK